MKIYAYLIWPGAGFRKQRSHQKNNEAICVVGEEKKIYLYILSTHGHSGHQTTGIVEQLIHIDELMVTVAFRYSRAVDAHRGAHGHSGHQPTGIVEQLIHIEELMVTVATSLQV